jgi:hypothetical protein
MSATAAIPVDPDVIMSRLDGQIAYYEKKSGDSQRAYKQIKLTEIIAAALIPFLAALQVPSANPRFRPLAAVVTALLGILITVLEGVLQLYQYHQIWITYRSTCEAMKHEKYTYLAKAGPYASAADPHALLAERVEALGAQENTKWASLLQAAEPKVKADK